jgi:hypothetical protein
VAKNLSRVALPDFQDWHNQSNAFSVMAYYRGTDKPAIAGSSAAYVHVARFQQSSSKL